MGIVGLGGIDVAGGVGGRGRQLIDSLREIKGVRIAALCDIDSAILDHGVGLFTERQAEGRPLQRTFANSTTTARSTRSSSPRPTTGTPWPRSGRARPASTYTSRSRSPTTYGKGRQMVAAARKHNRLVQVGTQSRSSTVLPEAFEYLHGGELGAIRFARAIIYRPRQGIGKAGRDLAIPATVDYDLWCGPAPKAALRRKQLHYEWHWFWATGNGEIGNNGPHIIDIARWALRQDRPAPRAISIGGRFGFDDDGETANTQVVLFDYRPAPLLCEVRNLSAGKEADAVGRYRGASEGMVIECAGGYLSGDGTGVTAYDSAGKVVKQFRDERGSGPMQTRHVAAFINAVRSGKAVRSQSRGRSRDTAPWRAATWPTSRTGSARGRRPRRYAKRSAPAGTVGRRPAVPRAPAGQRREPQRGPRGVGPLGHPGRPKPAGSSARWPKRPTPCRAANTANRSSCRNWFDRACATACGKRCTMPCRLAHHLEPHACATACGKRCTMPCRLAHCLPQAVRGAVSTPARCGKQWHTAWNHANLFGRRLIPNP